MKDLATGLVYLALLGGVYFYGYSQGAKDTLVNKAGDLAQKINSGVETLHSFPEQFSKKVDSVMEEVKSWFKWKRGSDGKIYLDPDSPIYDEVDGILRDSEEVGGPAKAD